MKYLTLLVIILPVFWGCQEKSIDSRISIGTIDSVYSDVLKEQRRIWVYVPEPKPHIDSKSVRYPVIYLLDGNAHFHSVTGMLQQLTSNQLMPECIVVAIPNTDRSRDLTPSHSEKMTDGSKADFLKTTGGGENFTRFIETELIPVIEKKYPTAPYRILIGHSFGGLFAMNTIIHHPQLFHAYISIDPSMWWDDQKLLRHTDSVVHNMDLRGRALFVSIANTMNLGMDTVQMKTDTASSTLHIRSIFELSNVLKRARATGLRFGAKYYNDDSHGSVPLISEYDGLRFFFDFYKPKINFDDLTAANLTDHFKLVSSRMNYPCLPPEDFVNELGYYLVFQKKYDKAYDFFKMNMENYPSSQNTYDAMGDFYLARGDSAMARGSFEKALSIEDRPATRKKFESLK